MQYINSIILLLFIPIILSCSKNKESNGHNNHKGHDAHQHGSPTSGDPMKSMPHDSIMHHHEMKDMDSDMDMDMDMDMGTGMDSMTGEKKGEEEILEIDKNLILKANIHTARAEVKNIYEGTRFLGIVATDEKKTEVISARVQGRVDKLFFRNPETYVNKGDRLYGIYSEQLFSDMNDYLVALLQKDSISNNAFGDKLIESAKQRLTLAGVTGAQINSIRTTRKVPPFIIYYSPVSGFVSELMIKEGQYVETGMPLFKLSDLKTLWVETQVYPDEVNLLNTNADVKVEFDAFPDKNYTGTIVFNNPTLEENRKINLVRIRIDNPDLLIKPGMMAYVNIIKSTKKTLVIPKSALIVQEMTMVWVEKKDGVFERRMVSTGTENKREVEILSGVNEGEKVVTNGSYLLNSEFILRKGANSMGGMKM